jgi:NAD(P)H-nitrite reductase large subunit
LKNSESYTEQYDVLVIATGSEPRKLPIEGINLPNVFGLKGLKDMDAIHDAVTTGPPNSEVVILGAG